MPKSTVDKVLRNIAWLLGDKILEVAIRVVTGALIARYLGAEWFGYLSFSLTAITLVVPFVKLGMNTIVVKYLTLEKSNAGAILGTAFCLQFASALIVFVSLLSVVGIFSNGATETDSLISILSITVLLQTIDPIVSWNQSQYQSKYTVLANRLSIFVGLVIKLAFVYFSVAFVYFVWAWVIESILKSVFVLRYYLKGESLIEWKFEKTTAVKLLRESWPMMFFSIAAIVYLKIDVIMLGNMKQGVDVGIYTAATRISELFYFLPTIVTASLLPAIVLSEKDGQEVFYRKVQPLLDGLALYSIVVVVLLLIYADTIIKILFGPEYSDSAFILKIHALALIFVATGTARDKILVTENKARFIMIASIIGAIVNIFLNLYLIPKYSGVGAAFATIISYAFSGYLACVFWKPTHKLFILLSLSFIVVVRPYKLVNYSGEIVKGIGSRKN